MGFILAHEIIEGIKDLINQGLSALADVSYDILSKDGPGRKYVPAELNINVISQGVFDLYTIIFVFVKHDSDKQTKYVRPNVNKEMVSEVLQDLFSQALRETYNGVLNIEEKEIKVSQSHMKLLTKQEELETLGWKE